MDIGEAIALGALQGLTEFLPVSSSGHLVLAQRLFGITAPALFFDTMLHAGTLVSVFVVLWRDVWSLLRRPLQPLTGYIILATLPAVAAALLLGDRVEALFQSGALLGWAFLFTAAVLAGAEALSRKRGLVRSEKTLNWLDALVIGAAQAVAILPAVSRSGMTISAALARRLDRSFAARFSFLLSIPAILGALALQVKNLAAGPERGSEAVTPAIAAGTFTAAVVGFFAIHLMLNIVRRRGLLGFAAYTALLGTLVLADQNLTHLVF